MGCPLLSQNSTFDLWVESSSMDINVVAEDHLNDRSLEKGIRGDGPCRGPRIVKLNIGGERYSTTEATLTRLPSTFFTTMFGRRFSIDLDETGAIFIDRDGHCFQPILTYLRTGEISIPPGVGLKDVLREARFYLVQPLVEQLEEMLNGDTYMYMDGKEGLFTILKDTKWRTITNEYLQLYKHTIFKAIGDASQKGLLQMDINLRQGNQGNPIFKSNDISYCSLQLQMKEVNPVMGETMGQWFARYGFHVSSYLRCVKNRMNTEITWELNSTVSWYGWQRLPHQSILTYHKTFGQSDNRTHNTSIIDSCG